jgi:hypothetical protein
MGMENVVPALNSLINYYFQNKHNIFLTGDSKVFEKLLSK